MIPSMQSTGTFHTVSNNNDNTTKPLRTAIAMNNLAIAMIDKHCYELGSRTLYDAYQILRHIVDEQHANDYQKTGTDISISSHNHHEALFRVCTSNNSNKCQYKSPISYETITPLINEPIYIDMGSTSSSKLYFIRLEDTSFFDNDDYSSIIVECSIILNNLAVSYLLLSTTTTTKHVDCLKFRNVACTFLKLACTLYMNKVIDTNNNTCLLESSNLDIYRLFGCIVSNTNKILYACGGMNTTTTTATAESNSIFCSKTIHVCNTIQRIESFFLACMDGINDHSAAMA